MSKNDFRSQLKATSIKKLQKRVDADNTIIGAQGGEYLNLEDGKTLKIRIFPAHPGKDDFYVPKKSYWLTVTGQDGERRRATVPDSVVHGGTKLDLVQEYVKFAKAKYANNVKKLTELTDGQDALTPSYTWLCYADKVDGDNELRAKIWEFKKSVRDGLNKLAFSEDADEPIEVDPFTDVDEGIPVMVKYLKNPNRKKGENYYEVSFGKKPTARPLTDEEIEHFMSLKPIDEVVFGYNINHFERALEGLQNFDEDKDMGLFDDDEWLEIVEKVKAQYSEAEDDEEPKKKVKASSKKKVEEPEEEDEPEAEDDEDEEPEEDAEGDEFDDMDRSELKRYIKDNELEISVKKSMSDDDIRDANREAVVEEEDEPEAEDDEDEDEEPKGKISLDDIRKKLANKK